MKEKISDIINRIRNTASDEPAYRVSDPFKAPAAVTVLPDTGGIFCTAGRDAVEIGKSIAENCDWEVYHVASPASPPVKLDPSMWKILTQYPSVPCVCMVDILANVDGKPYRTVRPISFTNTADGGLDEPIKFVTNPMLPGAYIGQEYKAYVGVKLGSAYTGVEWSIVDAPEGFRLEPAPATSGMHRAAIIGTPANVSDVRITVTASATGGVGEDVPTVTMECFMVVMPAITPRIITRDLGVWEVGRYRTVELMSSVMTGVTDIAWSVTPPLPAGLALDSKTGVISGTPEPRDNPYAVVHTFSVTAFGNTSAKPLEVTVYPALVITTPEYLPDLVIGTEYETTLKVRGAVGPGSPMWQIYPTPTPPAIHLNADGKLYTIRGEPAPAAGTHKIRVGVTDGIGRGTTKVLSLECVYTTHFVTRDIPQGVTGVAYHATIRTTGSSGVTATPGTLPPGLELVSSPTSSIGTIMGTPSFPGTYEFTLRIELDDGPVDRKYTLVIHDPPTIREEASLPSAMVGVPYQHRISATGSPDMTFAPTSPGVPSGMSIDRVTGLIEGAPLDSGAYQVGMSVSNAYGKDRAAPAIRIRDPVVITSESPLNPAYTNVPYEHQIVADGVDEGDKWAADVLPDGLEINEDTGLISGTPTAESTVSREYIVTITVTTPEGATRSKTFSMALNPATDRTPALLPKPDQLEMARIGELYWEDFRVENAPSGDITYTIGYSENTYSEDTADENGNEENTGEEFVLPPGLVFDEKTGSLRGVPESNPNPDFRFRVTAMQGSSPVCSEDYELWFKPARAYPETLPHAYIGVPYSFTPSFTYTDLTDTWSADGLPPGLTIDPSTGKITGEYTRAYSTLHVVVDTVVCTHIVTITVTTITEQKHTFTRTMLAGPRVRLQTGQIDNIECFAESDVTSEPTFTHTLVALDLDGTVWSDIQFTPIGSLPSGLEFNRRTNTISGTPTFREDDPGRRTTLTESYTIVFEYELGDTVTGSGRVVLSLRTVAYGYGFVPELVQCPVIDYIPLGVWRSYPVAIAADARVQNVQWSAAHEGGRYVECQIWPTGPYTAEMRCGGVSETSFEIGSSVKVTASYFDDHAQGDAQCAAYVTVGYIKGAKGVKILLDELPTVYEGLKYEAQLTAAVDGVAVGDGVWTLPDHHQLPDGLTLDPATGKIEGWVTGPHPSQIRLLATVTTATSTDTREVILPFGGDYDGEPRFKETSLPAPVAGRPYFAMINLLGVLPGSAFSWTVTGLPDGIQADASTGVVVCRFSGTVGETTGRTSYEVKVAITMDATTIVERKYQLVWAPPVEWASGDLRGVTDGAPVNIPVILSGFGQGLSVDMGSTIEGLEHQTTAGGYYISKLPTTPMHTTIEYSVKQGDIVIDRHTFQLMVHTPESVIQWAPSLPTAYEGVAYEQHVASGITETMSLSQYVTPYGISTIIQGTTVKVSGVPAFAETGTLTVGIKEFDEVIASRAYKYTCVPNPVVWAADRLDACVRCPVDIVVATGVSQVPNPFNFGSAPTLPTGLYLNVTGDELRLQGPADTVAALVRHKMWIECGGSRVSEHDIDIQVMEFVWMYAGNVSLPDAMTMVPYSVKVADGYGPALTATLVGAPSALIPVRDGNSLFLKGSLFTMGTYGITVNVYRNNTNNDNELAYQRSFQLKVGML